MFKLFILLILCFGSSCSGQKTEQQYNIPQAVPQSQPLPQNDMTKHYTIEIIREFPHDIDSYTQGLLYHNGLLYESTGLKGASSLQKIDPKSGNVIKKVMLGRDYFGEGIDIHKGRLYQLTWMEGTCFVWDVNSMTQVRTHSYFGEGWGLVSDGEKFFMSDGSYVLKLINPDDFTFIGTRLIHYLDGKPAYDLNELEFAGGYLYANIWQKDLIAKIDTSINKVVGLVDISPLRDIVKTYYRSEVSNGIAYNEETGTFYLTGKYWPLFFEVKIVPKEE